MPHVRPDPVVASALAASDRGVPDAQNAAEHGVDTVAYTELLGWYLGDGDISTRPRGVWNLHVYNDLRYGDTNRHIAELMRRVKPGGGPHTRKLPGCLVTTVSWKHWLCLFPQHGPGRKHERPIVLHPWQRDLVERHPGDFLRAVPFRRVPHSPLGDPHRRREDEA